MTSGVDGEATTATLETLREARAGWFRLDTVVSVHKDLGGSCLRDVGSVSGKGHGRFEVYIVRQTNIHSPSSVDAELCDEFPETFVT
jgi:hypothetical protein